MIIAMHIQSGNVESQSFDMCPKPGGFQSVGLVWVILKKTVFTWIERDRGFSN